MFSPLREWHTTNRFVNCIKGSTKSLKIFLCHSSSGTSLYYCVRPTEKQRLSCLWINCLNPHLLIQSINIFHKSKGLPFQKGESFEEANDDKPGKFYQYQEAVESYIGKEGKLVEYKRTARIDDVKPVKYLVSLIKDRTEKYKKYRSYVDNCSNVFSLMKDAYSGKYIELHFSQNFAIRPKLEVPVCSFFK